MDKKVGLYYTKQKQHPSQLGVRYITEHDKEYYYVVDGDGGTAKLMRQDAVVIFYELKVALGK